MSKRRKETRRKTQKGLAAVLANAEQLKAKKGPNYEKWRKGMEARGLSTGSVPKRFRPSKE